MTDGSCTAHEPKATMHGSVQSHNLQVQCSATGTATTPTPHSNRHPRTRTIHTPSTHIAATHAAIAADTAAATGHKHTHTTQAARRTANGFAALSSEGENDVESPKGLAMTTYQSKSPVTGANNGVEPRAKQQHLPALLFAAGGIWGCKGQAAIVGDDTL